MNTNTIIKFRINPDNLDTAISRFEQMIHGTPGFEFKMATIIQDEDFKELKPSNPAYYPITLYAVNGFIIKVYGIHCGVDPKQSQTIIDLLVYCKFNITPNAINAITNHQKVNITFWNQKLMKQA